MKRMIICAGLALALAFAATAFASTAQFSGTVKEGGTVTFASTLKHGKTKAVKLPLAFGAVPITCNQPIGDTHLNYTLTGKALKVENNKFSYSGSHSGRSVKITGEFKEKGRKATGTFREHGSFTDLNPQATSCDTGTLHWKAKKS